MLSDDEFRRLLQFVDRPWSGYRKVRKGVKKRVRRHMQALGCMTIQAYLQILQQNKNERARCEQALRVTISRFFRDRALWQVLGRRILPDVIRRFEAPIRIWSAGCANGEEAYSLALIWQTLPAPPKLKILASDTGSKVLQRAQQGIYNRSSLKEVPPDLQDKFFKPLGKHRRIIRAQGLTPIEWRQHDLFDPPPRGPFQMIFLRNSLLTYHQGATLEYALGSIVATLAPGGYLVVGSHERLPAMDIYFHQDAECPWVHLRK